MNDLTKTAESLKSVCELWFVNKERKKLSLFFYVAYDIINGPIDSTYVCASFDNTIVDDFLQSLIKIKLNTESIKECTELINNTINYIISIVLKENNRLKIENENLNKMLNNRL
jgi:hypothetical protein